MEGKGLDQKPAARQDDLRAAAAHIHIKDRLAIFHIAGKDIGFEQDFRFLDAGNNGHIQAGIGLDGGQEVQAVGGVTHGASGADAVVVHAVGPHEVCEGLHGLTEERLFFVRDAPSCEYVRSQP